MAFEQAWDGKDSGLICVGDEEGLKPTNTCSFGPGELAELRRRGYISLPKRLIAEGFQSVVHLKEQNRMHPDLAEFVNKYIYKGSLRNLSATERTLQYHMEFIRPKLHELSGDTLSANVFAIVASRKDGGHVLVAHRSSTCHACEGQSMRRHQGREALMMFLGLAAQKVVSRANFGFAKAISRVNVALTHGRDVFGPPAVAVKADW